MFCWTFSPQSRPRSPRIVPGAAVVGSVVVQEFGEGLPFLLKVLAADKPLSLQAHPTRAQAEEGHAREEAAGVAADAADRLYKDTWPKPEMLCALIGWGFFALPKVRVP